jgi:hypothetical protein
MAGETKRTWDVFISHSLSDAWAAKRIAEVCVVNGLAVFQDSELLAGDDWEEVVWEAVAESPVMVVVLSPAGLESNVAIEVGAARAWNKSILAVVTDPATVRIASELGDVPSFTLGRLQDLIDAIRESIQLLTDEDRESLASVYGEVGVTVDQLAFDPVARANLVKRFNKRRGKNLPGERLLSELLRLRKKGVLPKVSSRTVSSARRGTA